MRREHQLDGGGVIKVYASLVISINFDRSRGTLSTKPRPNGTNVCPMVTVPALLKFLYEWMLLHLLSSVAMCICEEMQNVPYKVSDCV